MAGLFPNNAPAHAWMPTTPGPKPAKFKVTSASSSTNFATRLNDGNCPRYAAAMKDVESSKAYEQARRFYYYKYKSNLEQVTKYPIANETVFDEICEYMFFSQYTNIQLNFTPTAFDRAYCDAYENGFVYKTCYGVDLQWKLISYEFLN